MIGAGWVVAPRIHLLLRLLANQRFHELLVKVSLRRRIAPMTRDSGLILTESDCYYVMKVDGGRVNLNLRASFHLTAETELKNESGSNLKPPAVIVVSYLTRTLFR